MATDDPTGFDHPLAEIRALDDALGETARMSLGAYIGPEHWPDVRLAMREPEIGMAVLLVQLSDGRILLHAPGGLYRPPGYRRAILLGNEDHAGGEVADPPVRFEIPDELRAERYTGGFRIHLPSGEQLVVLLHPVFRPGARTAP